MSAEVSCSLGFPEGAGKVDTTEANGRPHGFETAGGEAINPTSLLTQSIGEGFYKQLCAEEGS